MALDGKPLESINENDLRELIENKVPEGKTIEYKQNHPARTDGERKKYLIQISSFANASGGHLIYGLKEKNGIPTEISGLDIENDDAEKLRLDNIIRDGVEPRIWGVGIHIVPLKSKRKAIIIRIPKSFNPPHMVILGGERRFYSRGSAGKYQLDVEELRTLFGLADSITRRAKDFRLERVARIVNGEIPVPLNDGVRSVVHLIPFSAFTSRKSYDLQLFHKYPKHLPHIHWGGTFMSGRYNLDGFVSFHSCKSADSYTQVFRNGIIEAVHVGNYADSAVDAGDRRLYPRFEVSLTSGIKELLAVQRRLSIESPTVVFLGILGIKGFSMPDSPIGFEQDRLILPDVMIESCDDNISDKMRFAYDMVRNAVGLEPSNAENA